MNETKDGATLFGRAMLTSSFIQRLIVYIFLYVGLFFLLGFILFLNGNNSSFHLEGLSYIAVMFGVPAIPLIFWEYLIRSFRKERGLSIYKNIEEDLIQMEIDEQIAREQKAYKKVTGSTDKNDINYWFDLFQKGAITKEEYEAKKRELL